MRAEDSGAKLDEKQSRIAAQGIKALMPIFEDKTLLDFVLENLFSAGFSDFCLVIGNEHQIIREYCAKLSYQISFAIQEKPLGTANAVAAAEDFVEDDFFLVVNSDNLYPVEILSEIRKRNRVGLVAFEKRDLIRKSNISTAKINKFAVLTFDDENNLVEIIEKPETVEENAWISMNVWSFSPLIFEACKNIKLSIRGEYELADAVNFAVLNLGEKFQAVYSSNGVLDLSSRGDIGALQKILQRDRSLNSVF